MGWRRTAMNMARKGRAVPTRAMANDLRPDLRIWLISILTPTTKMKRMKARREMWSR